jgi:hypothetical protein
MSDNSNRDKITDAMRGLETVEQLASRELLIDARNAGLLDVEERLQHVLTRVRAEMENRGLF